MTRTWLTIILAATMLYPVGVWGTESPAATTYYVSFSNGSDGYPGTQTQPFKTIARLNQLQAALNPGDQVLFKCSDTWRGEQLTLTRSGAAGNPITYSVYPPGCTDLPVLSGTQPIAGWAPWSGSIYIADLNAGPNAGKFPADGINQLFRDGVRLASGRWPNLNAGDGGYSTLDAQPDSTHLSDTQLPSGSWVGATIHLKVIRWSMVNRTITGQNGATLALNTATVCPFTTNCTGWGFFINNSLAALDQDGEWYYDKTAHRVYLYSSSDPNAHLLEGSLVLENSDRNFGAINLGKDMQQPVSNLLIDHFKITGWYKHGISSPTNLTPDENAYITLQNNQISDVDADGINLRTWVYSASDGKDDWRGGNHIIILNNIIERANHFGIHTPSRLTTIEGNTLRDIALIRNLNESGMGCGVTGNEGTCTEDGAGLRIYRSDQDLSGNGFTIRYNRFEHIGANGVMIFGHDNIVQYNVFLDNCASKGDCGAINTFGGSSLGTSPVHDITINDNIILDTAGNTDGTQATFRPLFAFGLYIDNNSRAVTASGNTIGRTTVHGILYQNSTGSVTNNTLFNNVSGSLWGNQVALTSGVTSLADFSGNIMVSRNDHSYDLGLGSAGQIAAANNNWYTHAARSDLISLNGQGRTLTQWQAASGKDAGSVAVTGGIVGSYFLIYNDTRTDEVYDFTGWPACGLNGTQGASPLTLAPFTSRVLYHCGAAPYRVQLPVIRK